MTILYSRSRGWLFKAILLSAILGFVIALSASQLSAQENVTLHLPFSPEVGEVRVNRTGLLYQEEYEAAGHPTVTDCDASSYCNGSNGEYHDYNDIFDFTRGAIDFALPHSTMVFAAASGTVRDDTGMDKCQVAIEHSDGTVAYYIHLSAIHVEPGQEVEQGEHIGHVGSGCGATGPVLRFALWRGSKEIKAYFADASVQAHGGIVRPSRTKYVEYRYTADRKENQHNLLVNPSFESGSQPPWTWFGSCNSAVYSHSDRVLHGQHYLATNRKDNPDCTSFYQDVLQPPSVGDRYRFAIWVRSSNGDLRQGSVAIWALGGEEENSQTSFSIRGTQWQCIESSLTIRKDAHNGMRAEVYLDSLDTLDYYFDDATLARNGQTICPSEPEVYHYHVNPTGFQCGTLEDSSVVELALHRFEHVPHFSAEVRKCHRTPFVKSGELKIVTNGQVVAETRYSAGVRSILLTHIDPYGDYQINSRNTYVAEIYPTDDPNAPKLTGSVDAWVEFYLSGQADLLVDHLEVQREDTGASLSPGESVPDGTSLTINAHIKNCGPVDAEDFYLNYYDDEHDLGETYQDSVVSGACGDVKMVSHTFPITGTGQHTLRVNLDTKNDISESNESNNSATFLINVSSPSTGTISIPLVSDWNLISIPVNPDNTQVADVLASIEGNYELVYAFDCSAKSWKIYDPSNPPYANGLNDIDETMGLWIKMTQADTLEVNGSPLDSTTIPLCTEWNLVGYPSSQNQGVSDALNSITGAYTLVYAYDAANGSWKKFDPNDPPFANGLQEMQPGWGYWIKANQDTSWTKNN